MQSSETMDTFPTYAGLSGQELPKSRRCSDALRYLPMTSPVTPQRPEAPLSLLGSGTPALGEPGFLDSFLAYNISILDDAANLMQLALVSLPGDLHLLAETALGQRPVSTPRSSIVPPTPDLSREGPFDPYCTLAGTGDIPLTPTDLPGCRYRMTSYESVEVADVDPAYGLQLHHPRFQEFVGAPDSAR